MQFLARLVELGKVPADHAFVIVVAVLSSLILPFGHVLLKHFIFDIPQKHVKLSYDIDHEKKFDEYEVTVLVENTGEKGTGQSAGQLKVVFQGEIEDREWVLEYHHAEIVENTDTNILLIEFLELDRGGAFKIRIRSKADLASLPVLNHGGVRQKIRRCTVGQSGTCRSKSIL